MVVRFCYLHQKEMPEKTSKNKQNPDGSYKVYNAHLDPEGKMCFGVGEVPDGKTKTEVVDEIKEKEMKRWPEENISLGKEAIEEVKEDVEAIVEDKPMTRLDWNIKEFIKGLGVFSSAARAEGMSPTAAFENMAIWDWMDLAYGDMPGYEEWKEKAKGRIK